MLNGREIVEAGIISGLSEQDAVREKQVQQVGIDLRIKNISRLYGDVVIPHDNHKDVGKALPHLIDLPLFTDSSGYEYWVLSRGAYDIELMEGCSIPANFWLQIRQRSTLLRSGISIASSVFDPGFNTESIGTVMHVNCPNEVLIYREARVAQAVVHKVNTVDINDLYGSEKKGSSYQNDKQRK